VIDHSASPVRHVVALSPGTNEPTRVDTAAAATSNEWVWGTRMLSGDSARRVGIVLRRQYAASM